MASSDDAHDPEWRLEGVSWDADTMEASTKDTGSGGAAPGRSPNTSCQVRASGCSAVGLAHVATCGGSTWTADGCKLHELSPASLHGLNQRPHPNPSLPTHGQVEGCCALLPLRSYYQRQHICGER